MDWNKRVAEGFIISIALVLVAIAGYQQATFLLVLICILAVINQ